MNIYGGQLIPGTTKSVRTNEWTSTLFTTWVSGTIPHDGVTPLTASVLIDSYTGSGLLFLYIYWADSSGSQINGLGENRVPVGFKGSLVETFNPPNNAVSFRLGLRRSGHDTVGEVKYREIKVEYGVKNTPWCLTSLEISKQHMRKPSIPYGNAKINIDDYWARGIYGQGIKIAVMDDSMTIHKAVPVAGGHPCGKLTTYMTNRNVPHPINCASIAMARNLDDGRPAGVAPMAELYSVRMDHDTYTERTYSIIETIDWCIDNEIDIVSMSVHLSENSYDEKNPEVPTRRGIPKHLRIPLREAFIRAYRKGLIVVLVAGNHNTGDRKPDIDFLEYLPKMPGAITVANMTIEDKMRYSSGVGRWVDICGYGTAVHSCGPNNTYALTTGTSMSTPQIAGVLALYLNLFPELKGKDLVNKLFENCIPIPGISPLEQGRGIPNPPAELYDIPILNGVSGQFRIWTPQNYYWRNTETFYRNSNKWIEVEGAYNE